MNKKQLLTMLNTAAEFTARRHGIKLSVQYDIKKLRGKKFNVYTRDMFEFLKFPELRYLNKSDKKF